MTKSTEINKSLCFTNFRTRKAGGHKGNFGKVLIMAGSEDYPGAGIMAANGALRSGVGIVTLALPDCLKGMMPFMISPEVIIRYFPSEKGGFSFSLSQAVGLCSDYDAVLVGCGWGKSQSRLECLKNISSACNSSLIIDADGLNLIAENKELRERPNIVASQYIENQTIGKQYRVSFPATPRSARRKLNINDQPQLPLWTDNATSM